MTDNPAQRDRRQRTARYGLIIGAVLVAILLLLLSFFPRQERRAEASVSQTDTTRKASEGTPLTIRKTRLNSSEPPTSGAKGSTFSPQHMQLEKKILVIKKWNGPGDSFGLDKPSAGQEGATVGPSSVAYVQGKLCVLDNVNKRILFYDRSGNLLSSVALPTKTCTDLAVDTSGKHLLAIDHYENKVYKVDGDQTSLFATVTIRDDLPIGTKFAFDANANALYTQEVHQDGLADIDGSNLIIGPKTENPLTVSFDRPVFCVEEVVTDPKGLVWVLYTLEGDFQMRRIARIDPKQGTVGTTEVDVYFPFDATRHMVATGDGVVLFAGDADTGRLISFDYQGMGL